MKVLIADDSAITRKIFAQLMGQIFDQAPETVQAENGQEAIDAYKAETPSLVILDLNMPVKDGYAALEEIIQHDPEAKVVVYSGDVQDKAKERTSALGAKAHFTKEVAGFGKVDPKFVETLRELTNA